MNFLEFGLTLILYCIPGSAVAYNRWFRDNTYFNSNSNSELYREEALVLPCMIRFAAFHSIGWICDLHLALRWPTPNFISDHNIEC